MTPALRLGASLLLLNLSLLAGDLSITFQNSGKFNEGKSVQLYSADFNRTNHEGTKIDHLVDFKNGVSYTIHHGKKKIEKMSFEDLGAAAEAMEAQMAQMKEQMAQMPDFLKKMTGDPNSFSVDELGKDTVAGRKCNAYKMVVAKLEMEMSLDPSLKLPTNPAHMLRFAKYEGLLKGAMGPTAGSYKRMYEEMSKLKGVTLKTKTKIPFVGGEVISEATQVEEGPIPAAAFALPQGYTTEDVGKKMVEQARKSAGRR